MAVGNFGGRPRKPAALKVLEGDTRQRGSNKHEAELKATGDLPSGLPDMPKGLGKLAKEHWKYLTSVAGAERLFREADSGTLGGLCQMFEGFMTQASVGHEMARFALDKSMDPMERIKCAALSENAYKLAEKYYGRYLNGADRLGLSPAARARLQLGKDEAPKSRFGMPSPEEWKKRASAS